MPEPALNEQAGSTAKAKKSHKPYNCQSGGDVPIDRILSMPSVWPIHPDIIQRGPDDDSDPPPSAT